MKQADNLYELRKFILNDLIKEGYKYIARDENEELYAYSNEPIKKSLVWFSRVTDDGKLKNISLVSRIFTDINWEDEEPFEIPYVDIDNFDE